MQIYFKIYLLNFPVRIFDYNKKNFKYCISELSKKKIKTRIFSLSYISRINFNDSALKST